MLKDSLNPIPGDRDCRINSYMDRHERHIKEAKESESEILFIGDSLIEHLFQTELWDRFSQIHSLNFGMSGDKTQNVIWRILNGELNFIDNKPKVVVLLIGTNNTESSEDIVDGIIEIASLINQKLPEAHVLILSLFPKGLNPCPERNKIFEINGILKNAISEKVLNGPLNSSTHLINLDPGFVQSDGRLSHSDFYDYLHFTKKGYEKAFTPLLYILKNLICDGQLFEGQDVRDEIINSTKTLDVTDGAD